MWCLGFSLVDDTTHPKTINSSTSATTNTNVEKELTTEQLSKEYQAALIQNGSSPQAAWDYLVKKYRWDSTTSSQKLSDLSNFANSKTTGGSNSSTNNKEVEF